MRHEAPECSDYDDEDAVRRFEIAVRVHRAHAEGYTVTPLDGRVDGAFRVVGTTAASGEARMVDVVDASGAHDACTCPDFLTNELGTCRHLEAVRRAIARVPELRRSFARLAPEPRIATLTADATRCGAAVLVEVGPWTAKRRAQLGLTNDGSRGEATQENAAMLLPGVRSDVRVVHAAPGIARLTRERRAAVARRAAVESALRSGRLRSDILSHPLFAYQQAGAAHLVAAGRGLLADDMGSGRPSRPSRRVSSFAGAARQARSSW